MIFDIGIWMKAVEKEQNYVLLDFDQFPRLRNPFDLNIRRRKSTHGFSFYLIVLAASMSVSEESEKQTGKCQIQYNFQMSIQNIQLL